MSFGFSIGDFLAAIELANKIRSRFVDAPDQFRAISAEVKNLSSVLRDIDDVLSQRDLPVQQKTEFGEIIQSCQKVLKELEETLDEYQELDPSTKGFAGRSRRVWKRLRWDQKVIDGFRSRITFNVLLFNTFLGRISSRATLATKDGVDQLISRQHDQNRQIILDWLTPVDYTTQYSDFISSKQEGTGQWLLNSDKFRYWLEQHKQTLFCPGIPGAGKTMSAAIVVDKLYTHFQDNSNVGIAYIFCNFRRKHEQKPIDLLASLLKQLIQGLSSVPQSVQRLYEHHQHKPTRPSFDEISQTLQSVVPQYSKTFVVVDALDECQISEGGRKRFLTELLSLQTKTEANLFATSRFIPEIEKEFQGRSARLEIRATDEDLQRYLDGQMIKLPSFVSRSTPLQEEIKSAIINATDGMFLLARLHLDSLIGKRSPKAIRVALERLPKGSEAYDQAYREALERIEGQVTDSCALAKQALSWISCAKRPLTTLELQHALAVEVDENELDETNLPEIEDIVSACAGLVTVDEESNIIRLVHYTTQEFFERTWKEWFPDAQDDLATSCVAYLSFDTFESGFCPSDKVFEARLRLHPLFDYAARNWGHHIRESQGAQSSIPPFLGSKAKLSACSQVLTVFTRYRFSEYSQDVPQQITAIHLAAWFGLIKMMDILLEDGYDSDCKDSYGRTPLWWAAQEGHEAVVKLLLATDGVDPDSKTGDGQTPLSRAAENGHEAVVKLLLVKDGVDPASKTGDGQTPLSRAARNGHEAVVKLLLAKDGVDPASKDGDGRTPLSGAAGNGHEAVVKLLLAEDGGDPDPDALWLAAVNGHEAVVKLLLAEDGVHPDSDPLGSAAMEGHEAVVKLLLAEDGVNPDFKRSGGQTPLWWAAKEGYETVVKLLLSTDGVDPDSKDGDGRTPLWCAAVNGREAVMKLLLEKDGVDPNSRDGGGRTPLSWAAGNGHEAVLKLLLAKDGVDPDSKDRSGRTPLSQAAGKGRKAVVSLKLSRDATYRTPLWCAAVNEREAVVKLLLEKDGVDPGSKDGDGRTPLSWAAGKGRKAVVKLLLAKDGVDPDSKDGGGRTPLSRAAGKGRKAVMKLLLEKDGVDPDSKDADGRTPLSWAAENGHEAVVKLLLAKDGVDPDSKDGDGRMPLSWATKNGHEAVVKLFPSIT